MRIHGHVFSRVHTKQQVTIMTRSARLLLICAAIDLSSQVIPAGYRATIYLCLVWRRLDKLDHRHKLEPPPVRLVITVNIQIQRWVKPNSTHVYLRMPKVSNIRNFHLRRYRHTRARRWAQTSADGSMRLSKKRCINCAWKILPIRWSKNRNWIRFTGQISTSQTAPQTRTTGRRGDR